MMMRKTMAILLIALTVLTLAGCKKTEVNQGIKVQEGTDLDKDLNELDNLNQELNNSDLDSLDQDLEKVNW